MSVAQLGQGKHLRAHRALEGQPRMSKVVCKQVVCKQVVCTTRDQGLGSGGPLWFATLQSCASACSSVLVPPSSMRPNPLRHCQRS